MNKSPESSNWNEAARESAADLSNGNTEGFQQFLDEYAHNLSYKELIVVRDKLIPKVRQNTSRVLKGVVLRAYAKRFNSPFRELQEIIDSKRAEKQSKLTQKKSFRLAAKPRGVEIQGVSLDFSNGRTEIRVIQNGLHLQVLKITGEPVKGVSEGNVYALNALPKFLRYIMHPGLELEDKRRVVDQKSAFSEARKKDRMAKKAAKNQNGKKGKGKKKSKSKKAA